ncbi:hypothetical protein CDAR_302121 [Caerostris darwini]|uniref:Uncharacterized protein n=1 Tax=Caerostris darwini TaxID=1538125 RepID=A0AAV4SH81_9ARAC|nr:hypothetical protein CDAR_302121 [Caerostris darwini]
MIPETYFISGFSPGIANYTLHKTDRPNTGTHRTCGEDFSAAHTTWNNRRNSQRGIVLNNRPDIKIAAPHSPTHLSSQARYGDTIINFALLRNISYTTTTEVINELNFDYFPVIIILDIGSNLSTNTQRKSTNWTDYTYRLQQRHESCT